MVWSCCFSLNFHLSAPDGLREAPISAHAQDQPSGRHRELHILLPVTRDFLISEINNHGRHRIQGSEEAFLETLPSMTIYSQISRMHGMSHYHLPFPPHFSHLISS